MTASLPIAQFESSLKPYEAFGNMPIAVIYASMRMPCQMQMPFGEISTFPLFTHFRD